MRAFGRHIGGAPGAPFSAPQSVGAMRHFTLFGGRTGFSGAKKFHARRGRACAAPAHRRASGSAPSTLRRGITTDDDTERASRGRAEAGGGRDED
ncbi:hypothetical protein PGT21_032089 [Puccinia graminis f. sp. tritici]|uniref:Uncharacterized protein n=1 Tax=Puccinia graminis f. sp. tritici TaxID=56615 RepID=A0A5B0QPH0_PUCGR|nr:hypothetical protein PGT21_032089 [Puccinia graminis f. sp. tritici]